MSIEQQSQLAYDIIEENLDLRTPQAKELVIFCLEQLTDEDLLGVEILVAERKRDMTIQNVERHIAEQRKIRNLTEHCVTFYNEKYLDI